MNKKSLIFGIAVTLVWLTIIILIFILSNLKPLSSLNELGDFLAGIFAPVAFFWLILGYIQQGKQLDQNTQALEQQEQALQLQIEEMRESVKQQKELTQVQKEQFQSQLQLVEPLFIIDQYEFEFFGDEIHKSNLYIIKFTIKNLKGDVYNFRILNKLNQPIFSLPNISKVSQEIVLKLDDSDIDEFQNHTQFLIELYLEFSTIYSKSYKWKYFLFVKMNPDSTDTIEIIDLYRDN